MGILGPGYVGVPLGVECARSDYPMLGRHVSERGVVDRVNAAQSHSREASRGVFTPLVGEHLLSATTDLNCLGEYDLIGTCVPTLLNKMTDPNVSYVVSVARPVLSSPRAG